MFVNLWSLLLLLCLGYNSNSGKELWYDGWICLHAGDTLKGKLSHDTYGTKNFHAVRFIDKKGNHHLYKTRQMRAYQCGEDLYVRASVERGALKNTSSKAMLHVLIRGPLLLAEYRFIPDMGGFEMSYSGGGLENDQTLDYYLGSSSDSSFVFLPHRGFSAVVDDYLIQHDLKDSRETKDQIKDYPSIPDRIKELNQRQ
jgi:hypothetical protein